MEFSDLKGNTMTEIRINSGNDKIVFTDTEGAKYMLHHDQCCCESVTIEDINGDLNDLIGTPLTMAEEVVHERDKNPAGIPIPEFQDSFTWTFYKLATVKGYVTIRWYGGSNGYYSESVDFSKVNA